ncbi:MAG: hypothetical protein HC888_10390 [Candidatus Competibacteraceae bacterium]|nr:hypothetical protein [Candidatus Competibacteraceae bacterium]
MKRLSGDLKTIWPELLDPFQKMAQSFGKTFDSADNPLLVKIVESPMLNVVNTFASIHNIGLCEHTIDGFAHFVGEKFAYQEYARLFRWLIDLELKLELPKEQATGLGRFKKDLDKAKTKVAITAAVAAHRELFPKQVYSNAYQQLMYVINVYRKLFAVFATNEDSALLVQTMVYGNFNKDSCFGNYFTRDIISGENELRGEYYSQAFDETAKPGTAIAKIDPKFLKPLKVIGRQLEHQFKEIRRIRFTVENGNLWIIDQQPVSNKSTQAEIKTLLSLQQERVINEEYVINAIRPGRLAEILHPALDIKSVSKFQAVGGGIAGAVGAAIGLGPLDIGEDAVEERSPQRSIESAIRRMSMMSLPMPRIMPTSTLAPKPTPSSQGLALGSTSLLQAIRSPGWKLVDGKAKPTAVRLEGHAAHYPPSSSPGLTHGCPV